MEVRMPHDEDDELLIAEIMPALEIDHQYMQTVESYNDDLSAQIRRCGRVAARRLGYKVRTFLSDPHEGRRTVSVVVTESTEQDEKRVRERSELLIGETLTRLLR